MKQTVANEVANFDLLKLMPPGAARGIEAGWGVGALAREYRKTNPGCEYIGIELEADLGADAQQAARDVAA